MNTSSNPEARVPVFVDEVDRLVEFTDEGALDVAASSGLAIGRQPCLTEFVDQVEEYEDFDAGKQPVKSGAKLRPVMTDLVNQVVELTESDGKDAEAANFEREEKGDIHPSDGVSLNPVRHV